MKTGRYVMLSPVRWLETIALRMLYGIVQLLVQLKTALSMLRRRVAMFTAIALGGMGVVMVAAIPVSKLLLSDDIEAVAAVDGESTMSGQISRNGKAADGEASPFAALGTMQDDNKTASAGAAKETAIEHAGKHADPNYVCPMHPEILSKDPNQPCPICGMDLVLVEGDGDGGVVNISPVVMNALGVRTEAAKRKTMFRRVDTVGYIQEDENNIRTISLRTEGWVEKLRVKSVGDAVKKGQLLLQVYSPILVNAQEEYVQALQLRNRGLLQASEDRLRSLGVSDQQIKQLQETREVKQLVDVYAPQSGVISRLNIREGEFVKPAKSIVDLVDLSSVWLVVDVFERQADWVKVGQRARATLPFMPDKLWKGTVEYVYPNIDSKTRSLKVRLRFENPEGDLKPNMYADVRILADAKRDVLTIPREAIIRTGKESRVIIAMGDGKFIPMAVRVGVETDDDVEIVSGLQEGDEIVVSSQFLIDSEASVKAALMRMTQ